MTRPPDSFVRKNIPVTPELKSFVQTFYPGFEVVNAHRCVHWLGKVGVDRARILNPTTKEEIRLWRRDDGWRRTKGKQAFRVVYVRNL